LYQFGLSQYNMVHTQAGIYQYESFPFVYKLVCTTFQVKYILVHRITSPVDLLYTLLTRAVLARMKAAESQRPKGTSIQAETIYYLSAGAALWPRPAGAAEAVVH
jgi:hypothetical protein